MPAEVVYYYDDQPSPGQYVYQDEPAAETELPYYETALDQLVAPGLRLWMLLALIGSVLLFMIIVVCCFMKIRIPRTKREIELMAARRRIRQQKGHVAVQDVTDDIMSDEKSKTVIVMQSLGIPQAASDAGSTSGAESCTTCNDEKERSPASDSARNEHNATASTRLLETTT